MNYRINKTYHYLTRDGIAALKRKLNDLQQEYASIKSGLRDYHSDIVSNSYEHRVMWTERINSLQFIESEIDQLKELIRESKPLEAPKDAVGLGSFITVKDKTGKVTTYQLVDPLEANVDDHKISIKSPLAVALLARPGIGPVTTQAKDRSITYDIVAIS